MLFRSEQLPQRDRPQRKRPRRRLSLPGPAGPSSSALRGRPPAAPSRPRGCRMPGSRVRVGRGAGEVDPAAGHRGQGYSEGSEAYRVGEIRPGGGRAPMSERYDRAEAALRCRSTSVTVLRDAAAWPRTSASGRAPRPANKFIWISRSYRNVCSSVFVSQEIYRV